MKFVETSRSDEQNYLDFQYAKDEPDCECEYSKSK
jgi:hypothetical protein